MVSCLEATVRAQVLTLTDGPAITSLAVAPGGAHLIAHMVAHTLQLWPLASITSRLQAIPPAESPARTSLADLVLIEWHRHCSYASSCGKSLHGSTRRLHGSATVLQQHCADLPACSWV